MSPSFPRLHTDISAAGQLLCAHCLLIRPATIVSVSVVMGNASIHRAIFSHEAKVLYSSSNGDLNSPDSCIHCLVTLCVRGFAPPPLCASTNNFWFSLFDCNGSSTSFSFPFLPLLFLILAAVNFVLIAWIQKAVKNELSQCAPSHSDSSTMGILLPSV